MIEDTYTRMRIYHQNDGFLVSYSVNMVFVMIGARYNWETAPSVKEEMRIVGCDSIDLLHIPSWDSKICKSEEIETLLKDLQPTIIEIPSYAPVDKEGKNCRKLIQDFCNLSPISQLRIVSHKKVTNIYDNIDYKYLSPRIDYAKPKDNDIVALFDSGRFSVLSTGLVESHVIVDDILAENTIKNPFVLLVDDMRRSPFISWDFLKKYHPLIIVDMTGSFQFYVRAGEKLIDRGIYTIRTSKGDIIAMSGVRENDNEISTSGNEDIAGNKYEKEVISRR